MTVFCRENWVLIYLADHCILHVEFALKSPKTNICVLISFSSSYFCNQTPAIVHSCKIFFSVSNLSSHISLCVCINCLIYSSLIFLLVRFLRWCRCTWRHSVYCFSLWAGATLCKSWGQGNYLYSIALVGHQQHFHSKTSVDRDKYGIHNEIWWFQCDQKMN